MSVGGEEVRCCAIAFVLHSHCNAYTPAREEEEEEEEA